MFFAPPTWECNAIQCNCNCNEHQLHKLWTETVSVNNDNEHQLHKLWAETVSANNARTVCPTLLPMLIPYHTDTHTHAYSHANMHTHIYTYTHTTRAMQPTSMTGRSLADRLLTGLGQPQINA